MNLINFLGLSLAIILLSMAYFFSKKYFFSKRFDKKKEKRALSFWQVATISYLVSIFLLITVPTIWTAFVPKAKLYEKLYSHQIERDQETKNASPQNP